MGKRKSLDPSSLLGPFPTHSRPSPEECIAATQALTQLHGSPSRARLGSEGTILERPDPSTATVLDSLIRTILSQNTTDTNSSRAFAQLKLRFPTWEEVLEADSKDVEDSIRMGGLAEIKTARIKEILATLRRERPPPLSLEYLRGSGDEEVKAELMRFKGVGAKTVACVLMFCLGRAEFPVDTHVHRITRGMGWAPKNATRDETYEHLNRRVPDHIKYDLHVLLVEHGKRCARCAAGGRLQKEAVGPCPLTQERLAAAAAAAGLSGGGAGVNVGVMSGEMEVGCSLAGLGGSSLSPGSPGGKRRRLGGGGVKKEEEEEGEGGLAPLVGAAAAAAAGVVAGTAGVVALEAVEEEKPKPVAKPLAKPATRASGRGGRSR